MRLLLAEDDRALSGLLTEVLEKNNYSVDPVYDGAEALDYLRAEIYDGILLDIGMPKADGLTVLRTLRSWGCRTPVMIVSARSEVEDKVLGLDSGASDYVTKPFQMQELLARIRAMTRSCPAQVDSRLRLGNVTLDCAGFQLETPSGSRKLANKEFQMMELMMRGPARRISTEHFLERIWGYNNDAGQNVVWVNISYLRRKLAALGANVQIKSQRGAGYFLEVQEESPRQGIYSVFT